MEYKHVISDGYLRARLDDVAYNLKRDHDAVYLISGDGMVRVGKSVIAQQIGAYVAEKLDTPFTMKNVVFDGETLIQRGHSLPPNSSIIYDEARGAMDSKRVMERHTKHILDFFSECGMYNHFFILVMPDFFDYPKSIAVLRSEALINVKRLNEPDEVRGVNKWVRGFFDFYPRTDKKWLYLKGKKTLDYDAQAPLFSGRFTKRWMIDYEEYVAEKKSYVSRDPDNHKDTMLQIIKSVLSSPVTDGMTMEEVGKLIGVSKMTIHRYKRIIDGISLEN